MADCSELGKLLNQLSMNIAADPAVKSIDDIVLEVQRDIPEIRRQDLVDAINETTLGQTQKADDLNKELTQIEKDILEAKRNRAAIRGEARLDRELVKEIGQLKEYLSTGTAPPKPPKPPTKEQSLAIQQLRQTRDNVKKWVKTSDPVMKEKLSQKLDDLNAKIASGEIEVNEANAGKFHDEIQKIQDEIDAGKSQIRDERRLGEWQDKLDAIGKHLEEGTLPPKTEARQFEDTEAVSRMKNLVSLLRRQLRYSEPAVRERLEKRIADLDSRIESGDIYPKTRPAPFPMSQELRRLEYIANQKAKKIKEKLYAEKPKTLLDWIADPFNAARTLMTGGDLSFVLRQGKLIGMGNPLRALKEFPAMVKAMGSEQGEYEVQTDIDNRHYAPMYAKGKLYFSPTESGTSLARMDEAYQSHWINKIPVISATQRGNVAWLNKLRADTFDAMASTMATDGEITVLQAEDIARFINEATGRGGMGPFEGAAVPLSLGFFSPRFQISRFQMLLGHPIWAAKDPAARKTIIKEYAKTVLGFSVAVGLAAMAGNAMIDLDRKSPDFMKLRWGRQRIDILAGLAQPFVFINRLISGKKTNPITGKVSPLESKDLFQFQRGKYSPLGGTLTDIALRKDYKGDPVTPGGMAVNLLTPITFDDIRKQVAEYGVGPRSIAGSILSYLGDTVSVYNEDQKPVDPEVEKYKDSLTELRRKKANEQPMTKEEEQRLVLGERYKNIVSAFQKKADNAKTDTEREAAYAKIRELIRKIDGRK